MKEKLKVGIVGATGMVGQRFILLLENHPWFEVSLLAASSRSEGMTYEEAINNRWALEETMPDYVKKMVIVDAENVEKIKEEVDFLFCAVNMKKDEIKALEERYAKAEIPVVSNNSAHRFTPDVPMIMPEVNYGHIKIIEKQKERLGTKRGFIAVKPNCSIQSYVMALSPLKKYGIKEMVVSTYQAISGAGKTFETWPEMIDNVIPFISGEEEKSEKEPLKIWGEIEGSGIKLSENPVITTQCIRVPVSNGHLSTVFVNFDNKPEKEDIIKIWDEYVSRPQELQLPSAPKKPLKYFREDNRPQTKIDRVYENGMGITIGRLREDTLYDYKFVCLSHNTLRGAAGGAVLTAELLAKEGYITKK
ncbi:MAG: aspartate-semialdehyde dehydrogenase [Bacillota bacterium]|nr:aspartate-semialdehyde dehydrogenase [Bacillota bacterium]